MSHNSKYYRKMIKVNNNSKINTISKYLNKQYGDQPETSTVPEENDTCTRCSDPESENEIEQSQGQDSKNIQVSTSSNINEIGKYDDTDSDSDNSESACVSGLSVTGDKRLFSTTRYETEYEWLYWSSIKNGYMCKICELTSEPGPPRTFIDKGVL